MYIVHVKSYTHASRLSFKATARVIHPQAQLYEVKHLNTVIALPFPFSFFTHHLLITDPPTAGNRISSREGPNTPSNNITAAKCTTRPLSHLLRLRWQREQRSATKVWSSINQPSADAAVSRPRAWIKRVQPNRTAWWALNSKSSTSKEF